MNLRPLLRRYRLLLLVGVLLVLAALWWADRDTGRPPPPAPATVRIKPSETPPPSPGAAADSATAGAEPAAPGTAPAGPVDIFAVRTWEPPAPPAEPAAAPTAAAPPEPPQPPPLPFRYAGRIEEPGQPTVFFITHGEKMLAVRSGELINRQYRVGKLQGGQLHFLYRPLQIRQSIPVGGDT